MSTDICPLTPAAKNGWIGIHSPSVWQIEWQSGVNGQAVHFYQIANRGEGAVSVSTLNERSKRGSAIRLLSGDQWTDSPLSRQTPTEPATCGSGLRQLCSSVYIYKRYTIKK